jgi:uncharacterized protein (DUF433 family)
LHPTLTQHDTVPTDDPSKHALERIDEIRRLTLRSRPAVEAWLADRPGLDYDALLALCLRVWLDRADGHALRGIAARFATCDVPADVMAELLALPVAVIESLLDHAALNPHSADIARLHQEGRSPTEIQQQLGLSSREQVYRVLERIDAAPNRRTRRRTDTDTRRIVQLYRDGVSYTAIARQLGLTLDQVRACIRQEHADGRLPEYGTRAVVTHG